MRPRKKENEILSLLMNLSVEPKLHSSIHSSLFKAFLLLSTGWKKGSEIDWKRN